MSLGEMGVQMSAPASVVTVKARAAVLAWSCASGAGQTPVCFGNSCTAITESYTDGSTIFSL